MFKIGFGYDIHKFITSQHGPNTIWLCGVPIEYTYPLETNSDGDVPLHALTDAMLGAMAQDDIGTFFSPTDPKWQSYSSDYFLQHALNIVINHNFHISNIDITIISEKPKILPYREQMRGKLSDLLKISKNQISIKAKTNEGLDSIGQSLAIAAYAVVLCQKT